MKLIQFSSKSGKAGTSADSWQEELDSEEPLSVRAKKAALAALVSNKEADDNAALSSMKEADMLNKDDYAAAENDIKNTDNTVTEDSESSKSAENQKATIDEIKTSEKVEESEIKADGQANVEESVKEDNLDDIMTKEYIDYFYD